MKKDFSLVIDKIFEALFVVAFACAGILTLLIMISTFMWMNTL